MTFVPAAHGRRDAAWVNEDVAALEIPNGVPLLYRLDSGMRPLARGGSYLAG
jgi:bisphosphoglycerate-dependent phosphoglycerate mutase